MFFFIPGPGNDNQKGEGWTYAFVRNTFQLKSNHIFFGSKHYNKLDNI